MPDPAVAPLAVDVCGVAALLGVSRAHVYSLIASGRFPVSPVKLGRAVRYQVDEIRLWLASGAPAADRWARIKEAECRA